MLTGSLQLDIHVVQDNHAGEKGMHRASQTKEIYNLKNVSVSLSGLVLSEWLTVKSLFAALLLVVPVLALRMSSSLSSRLSLL